MDYGHRPGDGNCVAELERRIATHGWADNTAVITEDGRWTHRELLDLAARAAMVLREHKVGTGDRVLLALPDGLGWMVTFLAVARLGAVAVCVNPGLAAPEHAALTADAAPVLAVAEPNLATRFGQAFLAEEELLRRARRAEPAPVQPMTASDPLYAQYTSGTTGDPRGVVHDHASLGCYYRLVGTPVVAVTEADVTFSVSKLYFAYGFGNAFVFPLWSGSSVVLLREKPTPQRVADLVSRHRVSILYAVPAMYSALAAECAPEAFASVRVAVSAGESLRPAVRERATALLGGVPLNQLGCTEAGHGFCSNTVTENYPDTVGRALPGFELDVRDPAGRSVPDGEQGELWVRGPTLLTGFLNKPPEPGPLVDGWWNTRDLVVRNLDGVVVHHGRADDFEMVGGITIAPWETEQVLVRHPGVDSAVVTTVLDERGATKLWAYVLPVSGVAGNEALATQLLAAARQSLAPYKVPRGITFVDDLPRTATGKTRRFLVRQGSW